MSPYGHALCATVLDAEADALFYAWPPTPENRREAIRLRKLADRAVRNADEPALERAWQFVRNTTEGP